MNNQQLKWLIFAGLSIVWGSSFILMKLAMQHLSPTQVGALRMIIAGLFLMLIGGKKLLYITKRQWRILFLIALAGTFIPTFLFTFAIEHINSGIVAILNSFTPLNTLLIGYFFFHYSFNKRQVSGILIGIVGTALLVGSGINGNNGDNYWYALLVLAATIGYAINVNVIKLYLADMDTMSIAVGNFAWVLIPAFIVLYYTGFFYENFTQPPVNQSLLYIVILAVIGTALAMIYFNKMIKISSPVFASSVTYTIPIVALFWGLMDGEQISPLQMAAGVIILIGVYITNQ